MTHITRPRLRPATVDGDGNPHVVETTALFAWPETLVWQTHPWRDGWRPAGRPDRRPLVRPARMGLGPLIVFADSSTSTYLTTATTWSSACHATVSTTPMVTIG